MPSETEDPIDWSQLLSSTCCMVFTPPTNRKTWRANRDSEHASTGMPVLPVRPIRAAATQTWVVIMDNVMSIPLQWKLFCRVVSRNSQYTLCQHTNWKTQLTRVRSRDLIWLPVITKRIGAIKSARKCTYPWFKLLVTNGIQIYLVC